MKYLGQVSERHNDDHDDNVADDNIVVSELSSNVVLDDQLIKKNNENGCCNGINVALDFTLNCNSVQLTSRDISLKPVTTLKSTD